MIEAGGGRAAGTPPAAEGCPPSSLIVGTRSAAVDGFDSLVTIPAEELLGTLRDVVIGLLVLLDWTMIFFT